MPVSRQPSVPIAVIIAVLVPAMAGIAGTSGPPDRWQSFWIALTALTSGAGALLTSSRPLKSKKSFLGSFWFFLVLFGAKTCWSGRRCGIRRSKVYMKVPADIFDLTCGDVDGARRCPEKVPGGCVPSRKMSGSYGSFAHVCVDLR